MPRTPYTHVMPADTRIAAIEDGVSEWRVWISKHPQQPLGTYVELGDNGSIALVTTREGEGDAVHMIRPAQATCLLTFVRRRAT